MKLSILLLVLLAVVNVAAAEDDNNTTILVRTTKEAETPKPPKTRREKQRELNKMYRKAIKKVRRQKQPGKTVTQVAASSTTTTVEPFIIPADVIKQIDDYDWCPKNHSFPNFNPKNMKETLHLSGLMIAQATFEDFINLCDYVVDKVNEESYITALTVATLCRDDTQDIEVAAVEEVHCEWFISDEAIEKASNNTVDIEKSATGAKRDVEEPIYVDYEYETIEGSNEGCTAYFRESISMNVNHWIWHILYTGQVVTNNMQLRHGELFYYFHHQMLARYDAERFTCGLPRVTPFDNYFAPIPEAYFPTKLSTPKGSDQVNYYAGRAADTILNDIPDYGLYRYNEQLNMDRIKNASITKEVIDENGNIVTLTPATGTNILGNLIEASSVSLNQGYYGSCHNTMHFMLSIPSGDIYAAAAVIGFTSTAVRDTLFHRWHKTVDNTIELYKSTLPPYTRAQLLLASTVVHAYSIIANGRTNYVLTFLQERYAHIKSGLDFASVPVYLRMTHLEHEPFAHNITIENTSKTKKNVTIRCFLAPKVDHNNVLIPFTEQRTLFMQMDTFTATLQPGVQNIIRWSDYSSVAIPTQRGFDNIEKDRTDTENVSSGEVPTRCLCGWPNSHLLPRGTPAGTPYIAFVFITPGTDYKEPPATYCTPAPAYCGAGITNIAYPDTRAMGYPFDRPSLSNVTTIYNYSKSYPNMKPTEITIQHSPYVVNATKR